MTRPNPLRAFAGAALLILAAAVPASAAAADELWLHVSVDETAGAQVRVNLPLSFLETAIRMVPADELRDGKIVLQDAELSVAELRTLWHSLDTAGDAVLVEMHDEREHVNVSRRGGDLLVEVDGPDAVEVRIPGAVVDAMLAGEGDELDLAAALRALAAAGEGELVAVTETDSQVRVWVDTSPAAPALRGR
ncbi:MAG TPA: hypothetical protein VHQ65_05640 [Thermoanaerobaculia bacterium]|nr:hypothetical protein [Thermoanaerobaculia bacterium]